MARPFPTAIHLLVFMIMSRCGLLLAQQLQAEEYLKNSRWSADTALQLWPPTDTDFTRKMRNRIFDSFYKKMNMPGDTFYPLEMKMSMQFSSAVNLSSDKSLMSVEARMKAEWTDQRLCWLPEEFNNTKSVEVKLSELWHPEFTALNSVDLNSAIVNARSFVSIQSNGKVFWTQPMHFKINNGPNFNLWPSHIYRRTGVLEVGALINNDCAFKLINISSSIIVTSLDPEWYIKLVCSEKKLQKTRDRPKCGSNTFIVKYDITIDRDAPPLVSIVDYLSLVVAILNLIAFWIPPSGNCKLIISLVGALLDVAILVYIYSQIPLTCFPFIVKYYICSLILMVLTVIRALCDNYVITSQYTLAVFIVEFAEFLEMDIMDEDIPVDERSVSHIKLSGILKVLGLINKIFFVIFSFFYSLLLFFYVF